MRRPIKKKKGEKKRRERGRNGNSIQKRGKAERTHGAALVKAQRRNEEEKHNCQAQFSMLLAPPAVRVMHKIRFFFVFPSFLSFFFFKPPSWRR